MGGHDASSGSALESFRASVRERLAATIPRTEIDDAETDKTRSARMRRARQRQAALFDVGLAGLAFPQAYGGQGLSRQHQEVLNEESRGFAMPAVLGVPSIGVLGATLLDCGNDEQRRAHLPRILRGDEVWVQLLSEPTGGSDLAGARLSAELDGDEWVLNGSKMWTSNVRFADFGMCLARTDWSVPKHAGLTMFMVDLTTAGIEVHDIALATGQSDFCQEFFTDVRVSSANVIGEVNGGWSVASRLLVHERDTVGGNSMYARPDDGGFGDHTSLNDLAGVVSRGADAEALVEAFIADLAHRCVVDRLTSLIDAGETPPIAGSLLKLSAALRGIAVDDAGLELGGARAVFAPASDEGEEGASRRLGDRFLVRQAMCLAGGSNEMQRNLISERLLGLPREPRPDLGIAFRDVGHTASRGSGESAIT